MVIDQRTPITLVSYPSPICGGLQAVIARAPSQLPADELMLPAMMTFDSLPTLPLLVVRHGASLSNVLLAIAAGFLR